jgi:hypothetical protein
VVVILFVMGKDSKPLCEANQSLMRFEKKLSPVLLCERHVYKQWAQITDNWGFTLFDIGSANVFQTDMPRYMVAKKMEPECAKVLRWYGSKDMRIAKGQRRAMRVVSQIRDHTYCSLCSLRDE